MLSLSLLANLHYALEIVGAITFGTVAWLAVDAFFVTRDLKSVARASGFLLLALAQVIHAFGVSGDTASYVESGCYLLGLFLVIGNLVAEAPVNRPEMRGIIVLPAAAGIAAYIGGLQFAGYLTVTILAYRQLNKEFKVALWPFIIGFAALSLSALIALFTPKDDVRSVMWVAEHLAKLFGFFAIGKWVWSYLELRIREEMLIIMIATTLLMAVVVSLSFSTILVRQLENATKADLLVNARVLDFAIHKLKDESLAKARIVANDRSLVSAIGKNDFKKIEEILTGYLSREALGFVLVTDKDGTVLLRAHALSRREDSIASEAAYASALKGEMRSVIENSAGEGFSVRASAPLVSGKQTIGVVVLGYQLDNAFVDSIKRITGLELSIYRADERVSTTEFAADGKTRLIDIRTTDPDVLGAVMTEKKELTLATTLAGRPALASYLPIEGADGAVVGMVETTRSAHRLIETMSITNRYTLVVVIVIMLLLSFPLYLVTRRLSEEVH